MKILNYILSLAAVCTVFTACSSDDDPSAPVAQIPDATLSLLANTGETTETKASTQSSKKDERIDNLTLIVFNDGAYTADAIGKVEAVKTVTAGTDEAAAALDSVTNVEVVSGPVKVMAIANLSTDVINQITVGKMLTEVLALTSILSSEEKDITASSALLSVTTQRGRINCLGYTAAKLADVNGVSIWTNTEDTTDPRIPLYRTAARVSLISLALQQNDNYPNATFRLDTIFVANVKDHAKIANQTAWGDVEDITSFAWLCGAHATETGTLKVNTTATQYAPLMKDYTTEATKITLDASTTSKDLTDEFYVYPNQQGTDHTLLIVAGSYSYKLNGETITKQRYYPMIVNDPAAAGRSFSPNVTPHDYVMRNVKYNLALTIAGEGSDEPYTLKQSAYLSAKIVVNPWNVVDVNSDVE